MNLVYFKYTGVDTLDGCLRVTSNVLKMAFVFAAFATSNVRGCPWGYNVLWMIHVNIQFDYEPLWDIIDA